MVSIKKLKNGLTVIVEEMSHVESAAFELMIPGGIALDRPDRVGASLLLSELTSRGAGEYNSRALSEAFDSLGVRHSEGTDQERYSYRALLLADKFKEALRLVSLMVLQPTLPQEEISNIKSILLQDIQSLYDNPAQRSMVELSARYYPDPYNRSGLGSKEGIEATTHSELKEIWRNLFKADGAIFSVAGRVNTAEVLDTVETLFGEWRGTAATRPAFSGLPAHSTFHIEDQSAQLQIALCYPSAPFGHAKYYTAKVATGLLSGGMFGRLFTEVREKRGLCYSVFARHSSTRDYGAVTAYAGTTPERAHETLEVMVKELRGVKGTIKEDELKRVKANLLSALIISEESTSSRASSNVSDYWLGQRVRSLDEIQAAIEGVTAADIDSYLEEFPINSYMLLTLGARKIEISGGAK